MTSQTQMPAFDFKRDLVALIPFLRAFARSLCRQPTQAEDLAQEALVKAWHARNSFVPGTNMKAWLFTILRNEFYSQNRRSWRQMPWDEEAGARVPAAADAQQWHLELCDVADGLRYLADDQREALILVGAAGFSYQEAGAICGVPDGTVKSRVARGREALAKFLESGEKVQRVAGTRHGHADIMGQLSAIVPKGRRSKAPAR